MADTPLALRVAALPGNVRGAAWILAAALVYTFGNALVKQVGATVDVPVMVFFRCLFGLLLILPAVAYVGFGTLRTRRPLLHLARGVAGIGAMLCSFYSFANLPLATATVLSFTKPLFMIVLGLLFLAEHARWKRYAATLVGFSGVLVMVRPGTQEFDPVMIAGLGGAFFVASYLVFAKRMAASERPLSLLFYFALVPLVFSIPFAIAYWAVPTPAELALLALIGGVAVLGDYLMLRALKVGEASAVLPFDYSRLPFAVLMGVVMFAELPDVWTWAGAALIVGSSLYIARTEARGYGPRP